MAGKIITAKQQARSNAERSGTAWAKTFLKGLRKHPATDTGAALRASIEDAERFLFISKPSELDAFYRTIEQACRAAMPKRAIKAKN